MKDTFINIFWFRRDLRLDDNRALFKAMEAGLPVIPIFIFDTNILQELPSNDKRVSFIFDRISQLNTELAQSGSRLQVFEGKPVDIFEQLSNQYSLQTVFAGTDFEPYTKTRDHEVAAILSQHGATLRLVSDQLVLQPGRVLSAANKPYTVFTPFSKAWKAALVADDLVEYHFSKQKTHFFQSEFKKIDMPTGFVYSQYQIASSNLNENLVANYAANRDFPARNATSELGIHLRFGTIGIRKIYKQGAALSQTWGNELIWREFFMHILHFFPHVAKQSFRTKYDSIAWVNNEEHFKRWCEGTTGYPLVDAGMRQLAETGYMHNRVRMVAASFLAKHLLTDWRWGEVWFASKLMDFELSSNNGNWQWAAGTGCDAAPYFRVFNPEIQLQKFDEKGIYIRKWIPEFNLGYGKPMVEHAFARDRAIATYKAGILK